MKKLFIGLCAVLVSTASMAASANKMTMVTYFPVKYVAYSQVDVMKQMDVGLTSACQMNLGCTTDEGFNTGKSLRVNNLLKVAGGKLELNDAPAIVGTTAIMGSGNGTADFDFETNLRVANYKQGYTLQADNMYLSELNLFGYKFPACSGETMSWQKLKLKNKDEVYLVCGEAEKGSCDMTSDDVLYRAQSCEEGGHNPNWKKGIWSTTTCSCTCPAGTTMDEDGACIVKTSCQTDINEREDCERSLGTWNLDSCTCVCPTGTTYDPQSRACVNSSCSNATYKGNHKSECCPYAPTTDTVCWKTEWTLESSVEEYWMPNTGSHGDRTCDPEYTNAPRTDDNCNGSCSLGDTCTYLANYSFWNTGDTDCVGLVDTYKCYASRNGW